MIVIKSAREIKKVNDEIKDAEQARIASMERSIKMLESMNKR